MVVVAILIATTCMMQAAHHTLSEKRKRSVKNTFSSNPWFDAECEAAKKVRNRLLPNDAVHQKKKSEHENKLAVQHLQSVTARVKGQWLERHSDKLCEMTSKDPKGFWRAFRTQQSNSCLVELAAHFEAFGAPTDLQPSRSPPCNKDIFTQSTHVRRVYTYLHNMHNRAFTTLQQLRSAYTCWP